MRLGIDLTPLLRARTGIAVCTELLLESAQALGHEVTGMVSGWRRLVDGVPRGGLRIACNWTPRLLNPLLLDVLRWPTVETVLGPIDLFVATNYDILPARRATNVAFVHDVGRLKHPQLYGRRQVLRFRFQARRCARFADLIVVPSRSVADELEELGLCAEGRIRVVPLAARALPADGSAPLPTRRPMLLCVATLERRKNLPFLIRAFRRVAGELPHDLVIAGGRGPGAEDVLRAVDGLHDRIHFIGHADERQLAALYRNAELALCPSLYEGFGLPLLEAMAEGCPVLASDIAAHREVGGDAVRFVRPGDETGFGNELSDLVRDAAARAEMRRRGLDRSRAFTWDGAKRRFAELLA